MSVVSVKARSFILALFIRDDGERFLLGDNGYEFKDSQLHFAANTIENDEVQKQGADGVMVAGQVRRASVQSFDGYVGDATMTKETIEQMRRDFIAFFLKGHHFRVVYIDCNRNAWQRKGGYLVDAPEVKELWQIHPEYHVGLNFEDVNYYSYDEDADGEEILSNLVDVPVSTAASGGLVWDEDGAVSEDATVEYITETASATGKAINVNDAAEAPIASFQLDGETSQDGTPTPDAPVPVQTVTGENVVKICGKNLFDEATASVANIFIEYGAMKLYSSDDTKSTWIQCQPNTTYAISKGMTSSRFIVGTTADLPASNVSVLNYVEANANTSCSITTPANAKYLVVYFYRQPSDTSLTPEQILNTLQIELGSTATSYGPYQEQSYPISLGSIELCKIGDYQDSIYKSDGKWYVHKEIGKVTLNSSNYNSRYGTNQHGLTQFLVNYGVSDYYDTTNYTNMMSDHFTKQLTGFANTQTQGFLPALDSSVHQLRAYVRILTTTADTTDQFKAWLNANTPTFYYTLDPATDTEITNEALIEQLEAVLGGHTYAGTNNIFTITPNEQGTLEISYYTKYQPVVVSGGYVWEVGGSGGATIVVNNSIDSVNPIWKIFGPTQNPQLENSTTGETIEYVGMIAEGQTLTIDMGEQTASLDGLNVISNVVGDSISLAPGANRLIYSVLGDAGASSIGWSEIVG